MIINQDILVMLQTAYGRVKHYKHMWLQAGKECKGVCSFINVIKGQQGWLIFFPVISGMEMKNLQRSGQTHFLISWLRCSISHLQLCHMGLFSNMKARLESTKKTETDIPLNVHVLYLRTRKKKGELFFKTAFINTYRYFNW